MDEPDFFSITGKPAKRDTIELNGKPFQRFRGEFWTSAQRRASSIHEISYRACFKPQLPAFFIELLTAMGDLVYDPFGGRGTTPLEAGLLGRRVATNDINPISVILTRPRFFIPSREEITERLSEIQKTPDREAGIDISMFYHPETENEILGLREYLTMRRESGCEDHVDAWIRMIATNRLTGHSSGFFSVYTLPPNQAVSADSQERINKKRSQVPPYRDTHELIMKKTRSLLRTVTTDQQKLLYSAGSNAIFLSCDASHTPKIMDDTVSLTVTSPPFLNIVQYSLDNWLRCWFNGIDDREVGETITMTSSVAQWTDMVREVFLELFRITRLGGWVAFEVGEVRKGTIRLEEHVIPAGELAGFRCYGVLMNEQTFTKTSNIWGIDNNRSGTNTNRIVLFRKKE
ncbi:MAG TPA: DNA methyltransferase [Methanoregulaceae archaeon]|nr:DNA methyltransferase [Methanoregulaceae archaeon]